jgi:amidase
MPDHTIEGWLRAFARGEAAPHDAWDACRRAIEARDGELNAIPTRRDAAAVAADLDARARAMRDGDPVGPLSGLPWVAKDVFETAGLRTTFGSPIFADHVPARDAPIVARLRAAGAVLVGKSNTPEFAAGSQTFNPVLGATRNPHDPTRTVGGSSGGAACALATGMALVADGSDLAASLRNPASFCGVAGLRPSAYLDPALSSDANPFGTLNTVGPLGRTVTDLEVAFRSIFERPAPRPIVAWAAWLDALRARDPAGAGGSAEAGGGVARRPLRLAWSTDLGGLAVERPVREAFARAIEALGACGIELVEAHPDFAGADECFMALRAQYFVENLASCTPARPHG